MRFPVLWGGASLAAIWLGGAPSPLPNKESSAVKAARAFVSAVATIDSSDTGGISVDVGIATGAAFVGGLRSSDRMIWTALGSTTNLAARLQGFTRDLNVAIIFDLPTFRAGGDEADDFQRRNSTERTKGAPMGMLSGVTSLPVAR